MTLVRDKYIVKPLVNALYVLDTLRGAGRPMKLSEVADAAGLSNTTAFRYLKTFVLMGYAAQQPGNNYSLGAAALALAGDDTREIALGSLAKGEMEALEAEFRETVNLAVPKGRHIHYIAVAESQRTLRLRAETGDADCFHSTALGKAMIAFMPREQIGLHLKTPLPRFTEHTLTTRRQLEQALTLVRQFGYAIDREENEIGCICYAAPIFGSDGGPFAALSVSIPSPRLTPELDVRVPERIKIGAEAITAALRTAPLSMTQRQGLKSRRGAGRGDEP
jgi:DNA-binding IclR family transcriptional regulator